MPARDVLMNLGDAIAGVDRTGAFIAGQQAGAELDHTKAQTEAAMEQAKERRLNAELTQIEKDALDRMQAAGAAPGFEIGALNPVDIMLGKRGSDYSGTMQGRNYGQQYDQREVVATPAGQMLGETVVTDDVRQAALDALAPASAVATRRPRAPGTPIPVEDGQGGTILVNTDGTPFTVQTPAGPAPARPGARPAAPRAPAGPTTQQRNFEWLTTQLGVDEEQALRISMNDNVDPAAVYQRARDAALRSFVSDEEAHQAGLAAVEAIGGIEEDLIPDEQLEDDFAEGEELVGPNGHRIVLRGGVWVDAETGEPVQ